MRNRWARYIIEGVIHILFWAGVYYALRALTNSSFNVVVKIGPTETQRINGSAQFRFAWIVFGFLLVLFYSNTLWLFKKVIRYRSGFRRMAVIAGWFILLLGLDYAVIDWRMELPGKTHFSQNVDLLGNKPTSRLEPSVPPPPPFVPVESQLRTQLAISLAFLAILAVAIAQFFIKEWIRNDITRSHAEAQQLGIELKFLRSQVNPHFLFNTLNNLFSMAQRKGNDELADGISKLSGMMRYMLYESNTERVYLQKEIEYLKSCIALSKLRYADSEVDVSFSHPDAAAAGAIQIAPMLFIPFLENAFKHGVSIGQRSGITMTIDVDADQKKLIFACENTDHSQTRMSEDSGIGLANVRRRLELVYPGKHTLDTRLEDGKYSVLLEIDLA